MINTAVKMYVKKLLTLMIVLLAATPLSGCKRGPLRIDSVHSLNRTLEKFDNAVMGRWAREQTYSNTPTAYNQTRFYTTSTKDALDEIRHGKAKFTRTIRALSDRRFKGYGGIYDDSYGRGFMEGCTTYNTIMAGDTHRLLAPFFGRQNIVFDGERLSSDPWYLRGFQDAASFCTFRIDWEVH